MRVSLKLKNTNANRRIMTALLVDQELKVAELVKAMVASELRKTFKKLKGTTYSISAQARYPILIEKNWLFETLANCVETEIVEESDSTDVTVRVSPEKLAEATRADTKHRIIPMELVKELEFGSTAVPAFSMFRDIRLKLRSDAKRYLTQ